jgi:ParB/RepB/Spo0J family partition protein
MASAAKKITLSASRDIPFNKLALSQANVRRIKAGVSIEELAEDIARRTLLQSITVRPVLDEGGAETGMFEIPAGGRRYRALELLVKQKRLARTAPIPCVVRTQGTPEEDSLAENVQRAPLHPLDQFRAFQALREKGQSEEEIAAAFFVSVAVVKQRLRLASVSTRLLEVYAEDGMTLDQLMAFTVSSDHERQEQVWEAIQRSYSKEPYQIRRMLTEDAVRACDKRARYVGEDYVAAGGAVMRDLFQADDGGWLQEAKLLDRLVAESRCARLAARRMHRRRRRLSPRTKRPSEKRRRSRAKRLSTKSPSGTKLRMPRRTTPTSPPSSVPEAYRERPVSNGGSLCLGGRPCPVPHPNWRAVSRAKPRRCAAAIFPTVAAKAATGSSGMSATRPGARCSCGSRRPRKGRPANGRTQPAASTAICSTSFAKAEVSPISRTSPMKRVRSSTCRVRRRSRRGLAHRCPSPMTRQDRPKRRDAYSPCLNRSNALSQKRICADAALRLCTEPAVCVSTLAATTGPTSTAQA